jgi:hypothetical protein
MNNVSNIWFVGRQLVPSSAFIGGPIQITVKLSRFSCATSKMKAAAGAVAVVPPADMTTSLSVRLAESWIYESDGGTFQRHLINLYHDTITGTRLAMLDFKEIPGSEGICFTVS